MNEDLSKISRIILQGNPEDLEKLFVQVWIGFLGPKDVYRELKLRPVDEKTEFMAIYSMKIELSGITFLENVVAFEIREGLFIDAKMLDEDDLKIFLERIQNLNYPRVLFGKKFREEFGLPSTSAGYEARIIGIGLLE
ncbi:MAG: hypothetical protein ACP6IP_10240 [Candidatus Njordarchaeia archaeon]